MSKQETIQRLLQNPTYLPQSGVYKAAKATLEKISYRALKAIELLTDLRESEVRHVGTWVVACTAGGELIKWGQDGDTEFPYPPDDVEAKQQAHDLAKESNDAIYIVHVFNNGQMKQFSISQ